MLENLESAGEIDKRVDRLLRAADAYGQYPTPVDDIVTAAELGTADDYVLDESMIRKAPAHLRSLLRSARSKIQGLVDRQERVIHISPEIEHAGKRRFVTLHETTHHILPHQQDLLYADDCETLSSRAHHLFEREANQGAAELLFQRTRYDEREQLPVPCCAEPSRSRYRAACRRQRQFRRRPGGDMSNTVQQFRSTLDPTATAPTTTSQGTHSSLAPRA